MLMPLRSWRRRRAKCRTIKRPTSSLNIGSAGTGCRGGALRGGSNASTLSHENTLKIIASPMP
eukprot:603547-Lingulodinium_polyedra.AAC.1